MIHIQNYVFLMLLKTWMSKYLMQYQELMKQERRLDASVCNNNHVAVQINADVNENN